MIDKEGAGRRGVVCGQESVLGGRVAIFVVHGGRVGGEEGGYVAVEGADFKDDGADEFGLIWGKRWEGECSFGMLDLERS